MNKYYPLNLNGIQTEELRLCSVYVPMIKNYPLNLNGIQTDLLLLKPVCIPLIKIIR